MRLLRILLLLVIQGHFSISQEATVRGTEGGTLTAYCEYSPGWESYKKWWCRGKYWNSCRMLVKTTGSEQLVKKGRASIQDNHSRHTITMTLENLCTRSNRLSHNCAKTHNGKSYLASIYPGPHQQSARDQPWQQVGDPGLFRSSPESSGVDPPGATLPWDPAVALPRITASYIIQDSGQ
ncbi:CMRF35-like molecule 5 isoform X2 [Canis lupus familiaris]|uniref:CMRF35-like molecule 5 isoform X2 n=1 Tax=Canis lupus familiaris TaxID=9615 RepID=UPI0015F15956|nr:CMRF35-like molecule 5 isoform X2 [Canis lupus familiaris]XP_038482112.1 CMRF35-like molecule 5 isoform X2 [Canis lupus familiaris]XP_038531722.1 CMRF35-like molecule 5 isoform X2 [Canis lupus familiaris]